MFRCPTCDAKFSSKGDLTRHVKAIHDKIKDICCELCDYKTTLNGNLKKHIEMVHLKIRNIQCNQCDFKCSNNGHLKRHIKALHDKIRDIQCELCDYKCSDNNSLKIHTKALHDKIRNIQCELCEYKCSTNSSLKMHIKQIHDKIKDIHCPTCAYTCSTKSHLKQHTQTCTGSLNCSSGEFQIMKCLNEMKIPYKYNTSHVVKNIGMLRWDFIIETDSNKIFIEFDGKQHFEPMRFGGMSHKQAINAFERQKIHDKIKEDFCNENNYLLLRVPYTEFGNISQILTNFMCENTEWGFEY